jgi:putative dimethyl sulfoxide reductase chaperone
MNRAATVSASEIETESAESAAEKAGVYGLLAAIFRRELSANLLRELRALGLVRALAEAGVTFDDDFLEGPVDEVLHRHALAYTALFIGPGKHIPPYASVHMDRSGDLWGPATAWAKTFIEETGFEYRDGFHDLPDHIAVELEFMRNLWARESEALAGSDGKAAAFFRNRRETFLEAHLGAWAPIFCDRVMAASPVPFYAGIAKLTKAVIGAESARL